MRPSYDGTVMHLDHNRDYCRQVIDFSFVLGVALGTIVTGFCAIGSYYRGSDSVRRGAWTTELAARKRAVVKARRAAPLVAAPTIEGVLSQAS